MIFHCEQCGECCRHVNLSPLYHPLDRGDGICRYLEGNLCSIYETRPLLCRVEESYKAFFQEKLSEEDYIRLNQEACYKIKQDYLEGGY